MNVDTASPIRESPVTEPSERTVWWTIALRGLLAILFGIVALAKPGVTAVALVAVFAVWTFVDAAFAFTAAVQRGRAGQRWGWYVFEGIVSIAAGIIALAYPGVTMFVLTIIVGLRAIVLGVIAIGHAFTWKGVPWRWMHGVTGLVSVLFGLLLVWQPLAGMMALVWALGVYAIVFGFVMLALSIHVHGLEHERGTARPAAAA
jgi:uncharacterized membrane protein HdeD (DUF308 family)